MQLRPTNEYTTEVMDHHGLVAAVCRDLKIAEKINQRIGSKDPRRVVQPGVACVAMILNGLGFTNRRLYLTPQFFESKSMSALFEEDIKASDLNEHSLGKAADEIAKYGASRLYAEVVFEIALEQGLLGVKIIWIQQVLHFMVLIIMMSPLIVWKSHMDFLRIIAQISSK